MLKKKMLIALGVATVLSVSCVSVTVWAEENAEEQTEEAEDSSNSEGEQELILTMETSGFCQSMEVQKMESFRLETALTKKFFSQE